MAKWPVTGCLGWNQGSRFRAAFWRRETLDWRFSVLRRDRDFSGKTQRQHDKRVAPIGFDNENVAAFEPCTEPRESIAAGFSFDDKVAAENGNGQVAKVGSASGAAKRDTFGAEAMV